MKIELKNVKRAAFASQETDCFQATVYIDGQRAGTVSNEGFGGPNSYSDNALFNRLEEHAKTLPPHDFGNGDTIPRSADCVISDALADYLEHQSLKRHCAKKTLFRIPGQSYGRGEWHTITRKFDEQVRAHLVGKYGQQVEILNATL